MLQEALLSQILTFGLVFSRHAGFVGVSPFPGEALPRTLRAALVVVLTFVSLPLAAPPARMLTVDLGLVSAVMLEAALGIVIGFTFRMSLMPSVIAGESIADSIGLGSATLFNPALGAQDTILSRALSLFAMLMVLATGMHRIVLAWLIESLSIIPVGSPVRIEGATEGLLDLFALGAEVGLRLAMPVLAVSLLVQIALALIARVAPSLQVFNVGFSIFIAAGILTLGLTFRPMMARFVDHVGTIPESLDRILLEVGGGP